MENRTPITNKSYWALVLLLANTIAILSLRPNFMSWTNSFGMSGADTEGTMWWMWAECKFDSKGINLNGHNYPLVAFPSGIDSSELPFSNLVDTIRILFVQSTGCSIEAILFSVNVLPYMSLVLTIFASVFLMNQLTSNRSAAFVIGVVGVTTPTILLATRTSLSNNILVFGILSIAFCIRYEKSRRTKDLLAMLFFLILQISSNLYNGFWAMIACLTIFAFAPEMYNKDSIQKLSRVKNSLAVLGVSAIAVSVLFWKQLFLLFDQDAASQIRPFNMAGELLPSLILLPPWIQSISSEPLLFFESGWLPTIVIAMWLFAICSILFQRKNRTLIRWGITFQVLTFATILISHDFAFANWLHEFYFNHFSLLRGVSNYDKYGALFIAAGFATAFDGIFSRIHFKQKPQLPSRFLIIAVLCFVSIYSFNESLPKGTSFRERTSLLQFKDLYSSLDLENDDVIAHYPDLMYHSWGFPHSEIQIHQMFHGRPVLNGIARESPNTRCFQLPNPVTSKALGIIRDRGASILVLHADLMEKDKFRDVEKFLSATPGVSLIKERDLSLRSSNLNKDTLKSSEDIVIYRIDNSNLNNRLQTGRCLNAK